MESNTCQRELVIEIPPEVVAREEEELTAKYARRLQVPGFRPGRAPASVVRQRFREAIRGEAVETLVPRFFRNAAREQNLTVVGEPEFEDLKFEEGKPLTYRAHFEVYPTFELKEYKGLAVDEEVPAVSEQDVDQALERLREQAATFEVVEDRPAEEGDLVTVSYQGQVSGEGSEPLSADDAVIHLGARGTVKEFDENLRGVKPGDRRTFDVTYPEDFPQKNLAGKRVTYTVEVQAVKHKVLPPLDDDLARTVSELNTLEELRRRLRQSLEKQRQEDAVAAAKRKLVDLLLAQHEFPVPRALVEERLDQQLRRLARSLAAMGIDPRTSAISWHRMREEARAEAERAVRASLILERIAEAEKIEVSEEEVDDLIREAAEETGETPAALKTRLTRSGGIARLISTRRGQKALDFVYRNAAVTRKIESAQLGEEAAEGA